jgi:hypothetical protein
MTTLNLPALIEVGGHITLCGNNLALPYSFASSVTDDNTLCRMNNRGRCPAFSSCTIVP